MGEKQSSGSRRERGSRKMRLYVVVSAILSLVIPISVAAAELAINGKVLELDESNFESAISTFDFLLVDFYAPWCAHCKRLVPQLNEAARMLAELKEPIVIAKLDADKHTHLARKYGIRAFPTLMLFMHGAHTEYYGPRKADLLVRFLRKFVAPTVSVLNSDSALSEFVDAAGTFFPLYIGFGLNESVIENLAMKYKKRAWFSVARDFSEDIMLSYDFDKVPALVSLHPIYNEQSVFYGPLEENYLEDFVKQNLLPLALPINPETLRLLRDDDRKIVLTFVGDEKDEKMEKLIKLLKAAGSANRDLVFGYVGLKQWQDFADSFGVDRSTQLPKMLVWDGDRDYSSVIGCESMDEEDQGSEITRFLEGHRQGNTVEKTITGPTFMGFIYSLVGRRMAYIIVFLVIVLLLILTIGKEEPLRVGPADQAGTSSASVSEVAKDYHSGHKED